MGRKPKQKVSEAAIEEIVEKEVEFNCPINGRMVQTVKVKVLKKKEYALPTTVATPDEDILNRIEDSEEVLHDAD